MATRFQGQIAKWDDERGFGFVQPRGGGKQVFLHIKGLARRPELGDVVTYELGTDAKGRSCAVHVEFVGEVPPRVELSWEVWVGLGALLVTLVGLARFPSLVVCLGLSAVTLLFYGWDKRMAQAGNQRIPENTLHLLALLGGWPGALLGQGLFRHKIRKQPFRTIFWATVVLNIVGVAAYISQG
ncbi:MAG: DUF1294 domain-containing protein [Fimbriimonas sp.]